jgi:hypothetical protein
MASVLRTGKSGVAYAFARRRTQSPGEFARVRRARRALGPLVLLDCDGHRLRNRIIRFAQPRHDALLIRRRPVLAGLPFADQSSDRYLDPDDCTQLHRDEILENSRQTGLARATCARKVPNGAGFGSISNGTWFAFRPSAPKVTSAPSGWLRINWCKTSTRVSSKCEGKYIQTVPVDPD